MGDLIITKEARGIYERELSRSENPEVQARIQLLFDFGASADGNFILNKGEARGVSRLLHRCDNQSFDLFRSCTRNYTLHEVETALREFLEFPKILSLNLSSVLSKVSPIRDKSWRSFLLKKFREDTVLAIYYFSSGTRGDRLVQQFDRLTQLPGVNREIVGRYLDELADNARRMLPFEGAGLRAFFNYPRFNPRHFLEECFDLFINIAQSSFDRIELDLKLKPIVEIQRNLSWQNAEAKAYAIKLLGQRGQNLHGIHDTVTTDRRLVVLEAAYESAAHFSGEQNVQWLFERWERGSFNEGLMVQKALVSSVDPRTVVRLALRRLKKGNKFERARAAMILRYFYHRAEVKDILDQIHQELLASAKDPDKLVRLTALQSLQYAKLEKAEPPAWYRDYMSFFFRNPLQLFWIVEALKKEAQKKQRPLSVLVIGGSFGVESASILFSVLDDYREHPNQWNGFDPKRDLKILHTDISLEALIYASQAFFDDSDDLVMGEMIKARLFASRTGRDKNHYDTYFVSENGKKRLVEELQRRMEIQYLDITDVGNFLSNYPKATVVVYNQVDLYLPAEKREQAAQNVLELSDRYVTTAPSSGTTVRVLNSQTQLLHQAGNNLFFYEKTKGR